MSSPFGIPPPPPSQIFEPARATTTLAPPPDARPSRPAEPHRARRRWAITLAFVAGALLIFANLAVWLHFSAFDTKRSDAVAAATYDDVTGPVIIAVDKAVTPEVTAAAIKARGVRGGDLKDVNAQIDNAVRTAIVTPAFRAEYRAAVVSAIQRQLAIGRGAPRTDAESTGTLVTFSPTSLGPTITTTLVNNGYTFMRGVTIPPITYTIVTTDSAANSRAMISFGDAWWLFLLGAIVLGGGALYLVDRRLRLATIMAADAVLMLAVCLLLVPLIRQVVDDSAVDPTQAPWLVDAYNAIIDSLVSQTIVLMVIALCTAIGLGLLSRSRTRRQRELAGSAA